MEAWIVHVWIQFRDIKHTWNDINNAHNTYEAWATQKQALKSTGEHIKSVIYDVSTYLIAAAHTLVDNGHIETAMNLINNWQPDEYETRRYQFHITQSKFRDRRWNKGSFQ